jgi:hypothetical protein
MDHRVSFLAWLTPRWTAILVDHVDDRYCRMAAANSETAEVVATPINILASEGPILGRPSVERILDSSIQNLKALRPDPVSRVRFESSSSCIRPGRQSLLLPGTKQGTGSTGVGRPFLSPKRGPARGLPVGVARNDEGTVGKELVGRASRGACNGKARLRADGGSETRNARRNPCSPAGRDQGNPGSQPNQHQRGDPPRRLPIARFPHRARGPGPHGNRHRARRRRRARWRGRTRRPLRRRADHDRPIRGNGPTARC